jgi:tetratricopeptide (TPR) repeat protein
MSKEQNSIKQSFWNFDNLSYRLLFAAIFFLPILFLPTYGLALEVGKKLVFMILVLASLVCWLVGRLQEGRLSLPRSLLLTGPIALAVVAVVSALTSGAIWHSLWGYGFENETAISLILLGVAAFLVAIHFQLRRRMFALLLALFGAGLIVFTFQAIKVLASTLQSWGVMEFPALWTYFGGPSVNLIGKWYSLAVFFGLMLVLALAVWEFLAVRGIKAVRYLLLGVMTMSLLSLILINFSPVWLVVATFSALMLAFALVTGSDQEDAQSSRRGINIGRPSFAVLIIALAFIMMGGVNQPLGAKIAELNNRLGISVLEVRPSFSGTTLIVQETLKTSPLLGVGPNKFSNQWQVHKPLAVNKTDFWNVNFDVGYSNLVSAAVTTGILGLLAWLFFLVVLLATTLRAIVLIARKRVTAPLVLVALAGALYVWTFAIVYALDTVMFALVFLLTGFLVASLVEARIIANKEVSLIDKPERNFAFSVGMIGMVIVAIAGGYLFINTYYSAYAFQKGLHNMNNLGEFEVGERYISRAASLHGGDIYHRAMVDIGINRINRLLEEQDIPQEVLATQFRQLFDTTSAHAQAAVARNKKNFLNWHTQGRMFEYIIPLQISEAYDLANHAYQTSLALNPKNPSLYLDLARLEIANNNKLAARKYIDESLKLKTNFVPAFLLIAQIEADQGNLAEAIKKVEEALALAPNDPGVHFQLGYLRYQNENYRGAVEILARAVTRSPNYANAKYFLGLSYDKLGEKSKALAEFQQIAELNPSNQEVKKIVENLKVGRAALAGVVANPVLPITDPDEE